MKTYTLTPAGKKVAADCKPTTHSGAVITAVKKFKKGATSKQIIEEVSKLKLETKMPVNKLVSFMLFDLSKRRGILATKDVTA